MDHFESRYARPLIVVLLVILLLSFVPIVWISFYSYPAADDFSYALSTAHVWQETHSWTAVFSAALETMRVSYESWNGLFAAILLASLQPMVFDLSLYPVGALILFFSCVGSLCLLFWVLCRRVFACPRSSAAIISLLLTFLACQFVYDPVESFFWFTGGIHYTLSQSFAFFVLALLVLAVTMPARRVFPVLLTIGCLPFAVYIGGGNFSTSLALLMILSALIVLIWRQKKRKAAVLVFVVFAALFASFLCSVLSPGAALRQEIVGAANSPVKAIALSLVYGGYAFADSTTLPVLSAWLFITPLLYRASSRFSFSFSLPLVPIVLLFGVFCAQGTPVFYAIGLNMPERVINIIYLSYYPFFLVGWWYFLGWLSRRRQWAAWFAPVSRQLKKVPLPFVLTGFVLFFLVGSLGLVTVEKDPQTGGASFQGLPLSVEAARSVLSGQAADFHSQLKEREILYTTSPQDVIEVAPLREHPYLLFQQDLSSDAGFWVNQDVASFFHKESIRVSPQ